MHAFTKMPRIGIIQAIFTFLIINIPTFGADEPKAAAIPLRPRPETRNLFDLPPYPGDAPLGKSAARIRTSVAAIGTPDDGLFGTAFVISKRERLLATAAHVADRLSMGKRILVKFGGVTEIRKVAGIWYHPGIWRKFDVGLYVPSDDPRAGPICNPTADVALIQIDAGTFSLPTECELASVDEMKGLKSHPVGFLGFRGIRSPSGEVKLNDGSAHLAMGTITELTDYNEKAEEIPATLPADRRWIRTSAVIGEGSSGGPLFLENGHIIALGSTMYGVVGKGYESECVRVDFLIELMRIRDGGERTNWHKLQGPDQRLATAHRAVDAVREAKVLRSNGNLVDATKRCNAAIGLIHNYSNAYIERSKVYLDYCRVNWLSLDDSARRRYSGYAVEDAARGDESTNRWEPECGLILFYANLYDSLSYNDRAALRENIINIENYINNNKNRLDNVELARLLNCKAFFHLYLADFDGARKNFDESIRIDPAEPRWLLDRVQLWRQLRKPEQEAADRTAAERLRNYPGR